MAYMPSTPPPSNDSEDFSDREAVEAIETTNQEDLAKKIALEVMPGHASVGKQDARYALKGHALKRWKGHLYHEATFGCPGEPDKVMTFRIDWLDQEGKT